MVENAGEGPLQLFGVRADGVAAAVAVGERGDASDIAGQSLGDIGAGDKVDDMGRTVRRGNDGDVVAGAGAAVGAKVAHEVGLIGGRDGGSDVGGGELVVASAFVEGQVMSVDPFTGGDGTCGAADDLAVTADLFALGDGSQSRLVAGGDGFGEEDGIDAGADGPARAEVDAGNGDVITGVQQ